MELLKSIPANKKKKTKEWLHEWNNLEFTEVHSSIRTNLEVIKVKPWEGKCSVKELLARRDYYYGNCLDEEQLDLRHGSDAILCEEVYGMPSWAGTDPQLCHPQLITKGHNESLEAMEEFTVLMEVDEANNMEKTFWSDFRRYPSQRALI